MRAVSSSLRNLIFPTAVPATSALAASRNGAVTASYLTFRYRHKRLPTVLAYNLNAGDRPIYYGDAESFNIGQQPLRLHLNVEQLDDQFAFGPLTNVVNSRAVALLLASRGFYAPIRRRRVLSICRFTSVDLQSYREVILRHASPLAKLV